MPMTPIGDLAGGFASRLNMTRVKADLDRLTTEMSTGRPADPVAHVGGDTARVAHIARDIEMARARASAATGLGQTLAVMQTVMDGLEGLRDGLERLVVPLTPASPAAEYRRAGEAGAGAFRDIVGRLNTAHGGNALFAGTATDGPALADADAMLASLSAAATGAVTASDVTDAVDAWFSDPAGGFATMGYLGDSGAPLARRLDEELTVTVTPRADDPAFRELLRASAILALSADPALGLAPSTSAALVTGVLDDLIGAAPLLTGLRAGVGLAEERTAEAVTRHTARVAVLTVALNELTLADPYATAIALTETETQLQTQFVLTSRLSGLSLVNFLR